MSQPPDNAPNPEPARRGRLMALLHRFVRRVHRKGISMCADAIMPLAIMQAMITCDENPPLFQMYQSLKIRSALMAVDDALELVEQISERPRNSY